MSLSALNDSLVIGAGVTTDQLIFMQTSNDSVTASSYTGALEVRVASANLDLNDTITAGTGSNVLKI